MVFRAWLVGIALCAASIILASQVVWADGDGNALLRRGMDWLLAAKTAEAKTAFGACMEAGERGFVHRCAIADLAASRLRGEDGGQRVRALLGGGVRDLASSDDVHAHALAAFLGELPARFVADKTMEAILTHPERGSANTARLSQAYYYAGLLAMVSGDAAGAGKQFSRSVSANARTPEGRLVRILSRDRRRQRADRPGRSDRGKQPRRRRTDPVRVSRPGGGLEGRPLSHIAGAPGVCGRHRCAAWGCRRGEGETRNHGAADATPPDAGVR